MPRATTHVQQHKSKSGIGYTSRYNLTQLVYSERLATPLEAIAREKQMKGWSRAKKLELIETLNPGWNDLADALPAIVSETK